MNDDKQKLVWSICWGRFKKMRGVRCRTNQESSELVQLCKRAISSSTNQKMLDVFLDLECVFMI
ncbi:132_t:CDS:1, partial [Gigaspora margarita]